MYAIELAQLDAECIALRLDIHTLAVDIEALENYITTILLPQLEFAQEVKARAEEIHRKKIIVVNKNLEAETTSPAIKQEEGWDVLVLQAQRLQERGDASNAAAQQYNDELLEIFKEQMQRLQEYQTQRVEKIRRYADLSAQKEAIIARKSEAEELASQKKHFLR